MTEFTKYLSLKLDKTKENLYVISDETGKRELHSYNIKDKSYVKISAEQEIGISAVFLRLALF